LSENRIADFFSKKLSTRKAHKSFLGLTESIHFFFGDNQPNDCSLETSSLNANLLPSSSKRDLFDLTLKQDNPTQFNSSET